MAPRATRSAPASNGAAAKKRKTDPAAHASFDEDIINRIVNTRSKQRYLKSQSVALIGAGFSGGQPKGGVDQGPTVLFNEGNLVSQIKELEWEVEVEDHFPQMEHLKPNHEDTYGILKNVEYTSKVTHRIHDSVKKACEDGKLALTIGGDHSIAIGTVSGSLAVHKNIGLIWVDAHGDINTPEVTTSGNLHGCPVAFVSGLAGEVPPFNTWLKPEFDLSRIVYIGLRDLDGPEKKIIRDNNIKAFSMHEVDKWGIGRVVDAAVKYLYETAPDTKEHPCERDEDGNKLCPIHLSFDVDGLDPSVAPATGTPVRGGLTFREGHYIMEALHQTGSLVAVDITEVNPELGTVMERQTTISIGCSLVRSVLGEGLLY
ncbi:Arginase, catabolizes arginine to ornithine and urea [Chytriomyces hyalinus]|nr:Arginase, catabolizes arginine to ornithine and urea [Chytriomyces hyalinus]KAJ3402919.1 Arginase, catabolizes arginine to ornithine and urea [Chytriomyces hyalinus]